MVFLVSRQKCESFLTRERDLFIKDLLLTFFAPENCCSTKKSKTVWHKRESSKWWLFLRS